ncbi:MAG TPA: ABC transporter permease [Iamia sp.]|nr:ABC transporter permease [Iamia sp.]
MSAVGQAGLLARRNLLRMGRNPASLVGAVVTPAVFFLSFYLVMRKVLEAQGIDYEQYLPPAIVVQAMIFVAMTSAYFTADDRAAGVSDRLRAMPVRAGAVLAARLLADAGRAALCLVVVVGLGVAVGFRFTAGPLAAAGFVAVALGFAVALALAFGTVAHTARNPEAAVQGLALPYIVLFMLSTAFVPAERFPGWLEPVVRDQPVSQVIATLRALASGGPTTGPLLSSTLWTLGLAVPFAALTLRTTGRAR